VYDVWGDTKSKKSWTKEVYNIYECIVRSHSSHEIGERSPKTTGSNPLYREHTGRGRSILSLYPSSDPPCSTAGQGEVRIIARSNHSLYRGPSDVILEQIIINYYYLIAMITTQNPKRMISK
jgi:hypothetical protein